MHPPSQETSSSSLAQQQPMLSPLKTWEEFLVEHFVDGIIVVDKHGHIREFNPAAERMFRCRAESVLNTSLERFIPARLQSNHRTLFRDFVQRSAGGHEMKDREPVPAVRSDGEEFFADIAVVPINLGRQQGVACMVRDITERMDTEAAALQGEKLESLRILSAGLAHDFNNILTTIIGNAGIALAMVGEDSPAFLSLHDIREAGTRGAEMVQQMLRFAGRGESFEETVDVSAVVLEMCRLLRGSLKPNILPVTDVQPGLPTLFADPTGLRQIVLNLVVNAAEAIGERPATIVVGVKLVHADRRSLRACYGAAGALAGEYICIEVSDSGPGMDRATRSRVFDPFFSTKFAGRGLGLASVLGIARRLGGGIRVTSKVGRGSSFKVYLPVLTPREPGPESGERAE